MNTARKSRAVTAAEKTRSSSSTSTGSADGRWTRAMVGRAILAFGDIDRLPQYDEDGIRDLVRDFLRFVHRVEHDGIDDDAMPLARTFIARGYAWLAEHPHYAPVATKRWTVEMVERLILWFNEATRGQPDRRRLVEVADRVHTFERVLRGGAVEQGEADVLAEAFLDYAQRWLRDHPDALAHYQAL